MSNWLQAVGGLVALVGATPPVFRHPYSGFAGLRYAVGFTVLVAATGMVVFLLQGELVWFAATGALAAALGWVGGKLILDRMRERAGMTAQQQREQDREHGDLLPVTVVWVGGLLSTVGVALTVLEGL
jgi:hypothetical protein